MEMMYPETFNKVHDHWILGYWISFFYYRLIHYSDIRLSEFQIIIHVCIISNVAEKNIFNIFNAFCHQINFTLGTEYHLLLGNIHRAALSCNGAKHHHNVHIVS